ncbi:hypothetical protein BGZ83_001669 [Gryganskiella cystojenkinii]|nr:hypothetical protein BGZ83_001669 [Gryganskiella cystojenkinii]
MDHIPLEDEPFEPFDNYEDYEDEMMHEAERQDILRAQKESLATVSGSSSSIGGGSSSRTAAGGAGGSSATTSWMDNSALDALPAQRDYLGMLSQQQHEQERLSQAHQEQRRWQQQQEQQQKAKWSAQRSGGSRPIGSGAAGEDAGDLGDLELKKVKERVKQVRLDADKLLGPRGFPSLMTQGKALRIRHKYKNTAEKNANAKANMTDLMRLYQTWAHNLFPKANMEDFIRLAESRCKTDKQIRSSMNGWRDAYWEQKKQAKEAAEEEQRKAQEAENGGASWENAIGIDTEQRSTTAAASHENDPFGGGDLPLRGSSGGGSTSRSAYLGEGGPEPEESRTPMFTQEQTRSRISKQKQQAQAKKTVSGYSVSAAMRMDMSDEDAEDEAEFEARMARMRASLNQDSSAPVRRTTTRKQPEEDMAMAVDEEGDEEEEEEEEDEPLFTHRALKMMGRDVTSTISTASEAETAAPVVVVSAEGDKETNDEPSTSPKTHSSPLQQTTTTATSSESQQLRQALLFDDDEEDEGQSGTQASIGAAKRKPGRRTILLDDSDDE